MPIPEIEIVEEQEINKVKGKKITTRLPVLRTTCQSCDQPIDKVREDGGSRIPPHNRKVFRRMKSNGFPDWIIEACPGGRL